MGRLAEIDAEMHELPDSEKEIQETKNMRAYVLGFEAGEEAEKQRILNILSNKGLELEKDVSWDDEASHIRYVFMIDILELLRGYR
jgi:hypothetical protein